MQIFDLWKKHEIVRMKQINTEQKGKCQFISSNFQTTKQALDVNVTFLFCSIFDQRGKFAFLVTYGNFEGVLYADTPQNLITPSVFDRLDHL